MSEEEAGRQRFRATVSYHGGPYEGWQSQAGGNAVQDHLSRAVAAVHAEAGGVQGAGRTDAGVHAFGQVMHFDAPAGLRMNGVAWRHALNAGLPETIRVMDCEGAAPGFHARFSATGKLYRYALYLGAVLPGPRAGLAWRVKGAVDVAKLREAAEVLQGEHDFAAFAANRGKPELNPASTRRRVEAISVEAEGVEVGLWFRGEGFLYKMVRLMVGAMVRCGQGKLSLEALRRLRDREDAGVKSPLAAPAEGLYLERVYYRDEEGSEGSEAGRSKPNETK